MLAVLLFAACCGGRPAGGPSGPPVSGSATPDAGKGAAATKPGLHVTVEPPDAKLFVDGMPRDASATGGFIELEPGLHQVMVTRTGYQTWRAEVTVGEGIEELDLRLEKAADH